MNYSLHVREFLLPTRLGCSEEERKEPQKVLISLLIDFAEMPVACESDVLADTVCYGQLCSAMEEYVRGRSFATIEFFGRSLHMALKEKVPHSVSLKLTVHKVHPPIQNLQGGATFTIG